MELGLSYLSLDRAASTLSTGERQRMQLARAVRNRTTGVLYVLDEPSIGLHPSNLEGLTGVMDDLVADGNTVLLVDHDTQVLSHADWIVELGPAPVRMAAASSQRERWQRSRKTPSRL
jgi:excinuclease ABC subunit A